MKWLVVLMLVSIQVTCQQLHFLDSLFYHDFSNVVQVRIEEQKSMVEMYERDWGLSAGIGVTNSFQDQLGGGLSARLLAKADFLKTGYYANKLEAKVLRDRMKIDSLRGIDKAIDNNYGVYFSYIVYLYNQERINMIDQILEENSQTLQYFKQLYYNKLIEYDELLRLEQTDLEFALLKESLVTYNSILAKLVGDTLLPRIDPRDVWTVDFEGLCAEISKDSIGIKALHIEQDILDLQYRQANIPSLSTSVGYDLARKRPFFAVNFSMDIGTRKKQHLVAQKSRISNDFEIEKLQKKKELLNTQYEYRYKQKQLSYLDSQIKVLQEEQRKSTLRRTVLSLEEGIRDQKTNIDLLKVQYEIVDLKGQLMLLLLRVKKAFPKTDVAPFIHEKKEIMLNRKFAGNRYFIHDGDELLSSFDSLFLEQNEMNLIPSSDVLDPIITRYIDPSKYSTRMQLEAHIHTIINQEWIINIVITDLNAFKELELRTLEQNKFDLSAVID